MAESIGIVISGATGKMGLEALKTVLQHLELTLLGAVGRSHAGADAATLVHLPPCGVMITENLSATLQQATQQQTNQQTSPQTPLVCVDLTHPSVVFEHAMAIIEAGCLPVIGTTGLSEAQLETIDQALKARQNPGLYIPNFALGAVLMMKFAQEASRYFDHAEIIELHHNQKADAPSGSALNTARLMSQAHPKPFGPGNTPHEKETLPGARGASAPGNLRIHSVRLPGLTAHQEVLFGAPGQLLTLRHDSFDRSSFMPGLVLCIQRVSSLAPGLTIGLEQLI